jgi:hypothetical protein
MNILLTLLCLLTVAATASCRAVPNPSDANSSSNSGEARSAEATADSEHSKADAVQAEATTDGHACTILITNGLDEDIYVDTYLETFLFLKALDIDGKQIKSDIVLDGFSTPGSRSSWIGIPKKDAEGRLRYDKRMMERLTRVPAKKQLVLLETRLDRLLAHSGIEADLQDVGRVDFKLYYHRLHEDGSLKNVPFAKDAPFATAHLEPGKQPPHKN